MAQAVFIRGVRDAAVGPYEPAAAGSDKIDIEVACVGICGSDLHYYKDGGIGGATIRQPFVPGHEFSGRLLADYEALGLTRGTLVAVDPATPCGQCEFCHKGYFNLCPNVVFQGAPPYDGAMTERIAVPLHNLVSLPDGMTAVQAAMLEPLGVCIHAVDLARPRLLESVAVLGCGPIGLGIIQLLRLSGVGEIIAIDPQQHRAALAGKMGADRVAGHLDAVGDLTHGRGTDLVVEATNSPDGFAHAVRAAAIGGRLVLVGIPDGDRYGLEAAEARRRGLTIRFSRRMGEVYPRAVALVASGQVDVDAMVSHHVDLSGTPDAFAKQAEEEPGLIKTIIYPNGMI